MNDWNHDGNLDNSDTFMDYMIYKEVMGEKKQKPKQEGCYIATCVYGSYECPQVRALRRFRDEKLRRSAAGRLFIQCYYAVSPAMVRRFGSKVWFRRLWKKALDPIVNRVST